MPSVLIVDDMRLFADIVALELEKYGYQVLIADAGAEAVRIVRMDHPSLVILDIATPILGGIDTLRLIRTNRHPVVAGIPVLALTASWRPAQQAEAGRLGIQGHLLKSRFSVADLVLRVNELVPTPPRAAQ